MRLARDVVGPLLIVGSVLALAVPASAGPRNDEDLVAEDEVPTGSTEPVTTEVPVVCSSSDMRFLGNTSSDSGQYIYFYIDARYWRAEPATGRMWVRSTEVCRQDQSQVSSRMYWRLLSDPDPRLVADVLRDRQAKQLPLPEPNLSPVGPGVVQLGMWLAVDDPGPDSVTASAASGSWVTVSAETVETTFDMGNGDVVVCAGLGDPIPRSELDSIEESPVCGYTYRQLNDGQPYTITVTSTWAVSFTSSRGTGGPLEPVYKSASFAYDVREIQTVGVDG